MLNFWMKYGFILIYFGELILLCDELIINVKNFNYVIFIIIEKLNFVL